ncbi:hypothetical protein DH2020_010363 [Rehmannia glutinosa]|uniref:Uncharacterized protein n=1 Tax=Rehmannia glutinosa TaxID=99300 RepID=A0ABR0XAG2_REHGL
MHCSVAAENSHVFTPSPRKTSSTFCKAVTSPPSPSISSPSSFVPKYIRKALYEGDEEELGSPKVATMLKRKRPAKIDIPVASLEFDDIKAMSDLDRWSEVEFDGDGYSVYCKRGKRGGVMEDRYAAVLGLQGDSKQHLEKNIMNEVSKKSEEIEEAVKAGYLTTDSRVLKKDIRGWLCGPFVVFAEYMDLLMYQEQLEIVSNQEAVDVVRSLCVSVDKPEPLFACKKLVDLSLTRGSLDDISVMVIQLISIH